MGIFGRIKGIFRRKKKELPPVPAEATRLAKPPTTEAATMENMKAKMDLMMTHLDSLKVQNETLNERIKNIERLVTEIRGYCK